MVIIKKFLVKIVLLSVICMLFYWNIGVACTFTVNPISFEYDPLYEADTQFTTLLTITCPQNRTVDVYFDGDQKGNIYKRIVEGMYGDLLIYDLFTDAGRTRLWGNGLMGTYYVTVNVRRNRPLTLTVYGLSYAQQDVSIGLYKGTVTARIEY